MSLCALVNIVCRKVTIYLHECWLAGGILFACTVQYNLAHSEVQSQRHELGHIGESRKVHTPSRCVRGVSAYLFGQAVRPAGQSRARRW